MFYSFYCTPNVFKSYFATNKIKSGTHFKHLNSSLITSLFFQMKNLIAFDFDHTIIDKNSDIVAIDLLPKGSIPENLRMLYKEDGWTNFMQGIFKLLHEHNFYEDKIRNVIGDLEPTTGMCELIKEVSEKFNYDVIIISDSNSYFINVWLEKHQLKDKVLKVFTNPAQFSNGLLQIKMYHLQEKCKLSTKNLCKGQILEDFIDTQNKNSVTYDKVIYVGDGANDFCPILRLKAKDLACVREDYKLSTMVKNTLEGKPIDSSNLVYTIKSNIVMWKTGLDILKAVT